MTISELEKTLRAGSVPQAAIITGAPIERLEEAARLFSRAAVCSAPPLCGRCADCRKAAAGVHPDISTVNKDADKKELSVELVRRARAAAFVVPNEARRSVTVIRDGDAMNPAAQNALLKILEEPPAHAVFVILCENSERLLPTVRSRCAAIRLSPEDAEAPEEAAKWAEALTGAVIKGDRRAMLDAAIALEKLSRQELADFIAAARTLAVRSFDRLSKERFDKLTGALDTAERYLAVNVSAGHVSGLIMAELIYQ